MKVSFIITAYNIPPDMLSQCVESILALSLQPHEREIILVDDGSKTSPLEHLGAYLESITYIRQQNQGLSAARNTGLRTATGTFIQFLDGDDMLIPNQYEQCLNIIRNNHTDMVMFKLTNTSPLQQFNNSTIQQFNNGSDLMRTRNIHGTACGYLFRRAILGSLSFTNGILHEDEEFTPKLLLRAETVHLTDAKAYYYRQRDGSITTNNNPIQIQKRLNDLKGIIQRLNQLADQLPVNDRQGMNRRVAQLTMDYLYNIIVHTRDANTLNHEIKDLRQDGLFPLPNEPYTRKYNTFRIMINSATGRRILLLTLPHMKRER